MTKLFKNSKSILSLVLAFAVLAVSLFTGVVINTEAANCDDDVNVVYVKYGTEANGECDDTFLDGTHGTGTEADPYIISTPGQLRYIAQKSTSATTYGKFYKIDDSIDMMVLQSEGYINTVAGSLDAFLALDAEGVKDALSNSTSRTQWQSATSAEGYDSFAGTLDFNGVTICGMYNGNGGVIAIANGGATLKNLTLCNNYISSGWYNGNLVGYVHNGTAGNAEYRDFTISNVVVHDCYQYTTGNGYGNTGVLVGTGLNSSKIPFHFSNILTYDNISLATVSSSDTTEKECALYGTLPTSWTGESDGVQNASYNNIVTLDCVPYPTHAINNQCTRATFFSSVYTTDVIEATPNTWDKDWSKFDITVLTNADAAKGTAAMTTMPKLDWANTWVAVDGAYPDLRSNHNITMTDNGNGTHKEACEDCGLTIGNAMDHNFVEGVCACGYKAKCGEVIAYWDGSSTAPASKAAGTEADPIIISTAAELNYVLRQAGVGITTGKYYKIADGIDKMVLQPKGILDLEALLACEDGAAVKAYFDTLDAAKLVTWQGGGVFNGNIDGNGVQIVGLYDTTSNLAGFVGAFDGGKQFTKDAPGFDYVGNTIKGFTVSYSYFESNNRLGVFGSQAYANGYGAYVTGTLNVDTCAVINCHIKQTEKAFGTGHSGIVAGDINADVVKFNNLIVYGNDATDMNGDALWIRGGGANGVKIEGTEEFNYNSTTNSIILGALPYMNDWIRNRLNDPAAFSNVYTDAPVGEVTFGNGTGFTYEESQLKSVEGLTGAELKEACTGLDWTNTFLATADMPTFRAMHDSEFSATYDAETHSLSCSCGLAIEAAPHDWSNKDGVCAAGCGYECTHGDGEAVISTEKTPATCTDAAWYYDECTICGISTEEIEDGLYQDGDPLGHDMKIVEGTPAKCGVAGVKDYYDCSRCDYVSEDKAGAIPIDNLDEWKVIPALEHTPALDDEGKIVYAWDETTPGMHYTVCGTCGEKYDGEACTGEYTYDDEGHEGKCTVCGIETEGKEPHGNFDENHKCGTCDWVCPHAEYVDGTAEGDVTTHYTNIDVCKTIKTYCAVCGTQGEDREVPHDVEGQEWKDLDSTATCTEAGELTQYKKCNVCEGYGEKQTVPAEATGHDFYEYDETDSTCSTEGHIAYKECGNCWNMFAADAADDEAMENALDYDEVFKAIDPEAHTWVEYEESEADCDNAGYAEDHKFCSECYLFVIGEEATDIVVDWGAFYEEEYDEDGNVTPIGEGAIAGEKEAALYEEILAEYLAENGLELPEMPAEDASFEEWMEYYDARSEVMNQVDWEEFDAIWTPIADEIWTEAFHNYFLAAAAEDEDLGDLVVPALGHNLVKVDKVEATYDKEGTEAHWACEDCDKLFADEDGAQEVTAEELVIAKLVKEEEKGDNITEDKKDDTSTEDKKDDTSTNDKAEGDKSTTSPATGETVATVAAAVAAIIAAGFVLVRKAKKA